MNVTLYKYTNLNSWIEDISIGLPHLGYRFLKQRNGVFAYQEKILTKLKGVEQADGFLIVREPLGLGEWALGIKDHRKYFDSVTGDAIKQSEQVLFGGNPQKYPRPFERIKACARLGAKLGEVLDGFTGESLAPDSFERKVHEKNHLVTKSGEAPINPSIGRLLKFNGFLKYPTNLGRSNGSDCQMTLPRL